MELIKINSSKLKIILSAEDITELGLNPESKDCEDSLSMKSFRDILEKARVKTGFTSGASRLYVQFYPSKDGGGEMYVTKKEYQSYISQNKHFGDTAKVPESSTYIAVFTAFETMLRLCKRLKQDDYIGESTLYTYNDEYILILCGHSYSNYYTYLSEYSECSVANSIKLAFIEEHGSLICKNTTVETFCEKFGLTI